MAQKRKKTKKWISWAILLVLFVVAGVMVFLVWDSYFREKDDKADEQETEQVEEVEENDEIEEEKMEVTQKQKVEQYEGDDPNEAEELSGVVTYAGVNGDKLMIRVNIDQYLDSGECKLSLSRNGTIIYNDVASVVGSASTSTCEGFDVPIGGIGSGAVNIVINVQSGGKVGAISGEANI